jgi:hypothetical protein
MKDFPNYESHIPVPRQFSNQQYWEGFGTATYTGKSHGDLGLEIHFEETDLVDISDAHEVIPLRPLLSHFVFPKSNRRVIRQ